MFKSKKYYRRSISAALALVLALLISTATPHAQFRGNPEGNAPNVRTEKTDAYSNHWLNPGVIPPNARPYGLTYAQWSARWEQWVLGLPVAGNPQLGCPDPPNAGQAGPVWFISPQIGAPASCTIRVPAGKAIFVPLMAAYVDSLSVLPWVSNMPLTTEEEQRYWAQFFANHIVPSSLFCEIDGVPVCNLTQYRFTSPQFHFLAPTPWVGGDVGGQATAVADGYYLILHPLSAGTHTIHWGSAIHLSVAEGDPFDADVASDMTYHLTVRR